MKSALALSLPLLASGAAVPLELHRRQLDLFGLGQANKTPQKTVSSTKLKSIYQQDAIRERLLWGPFKLQPANGTHDKAGSTLKLDSSSDVISTRIAGLCQNCMVLSAKADLANKAGEKMDLGEGVYSHHIIVTDVGRKMVAPAVVAKCANGKPGGFNFGGMVMGAPKSTGTSGGAMGGMSHGGHGHQRYTAPSQTTPPPSAASDNSLSALGLPAMPEGLAPILGAVGGGALGAALLAALGAALGSALGGYAGMQAGAPATPSAAPGAPAAAAPKAGSGSSGLPSGLLGLMPAVSVFIGQGDEGSGLKFTANNKALKSGFWISEKDEINLMAEVINYKNTAQEIYIKIEYEYIPNLGNRPDEYYDVGMGAINVAPCESVNLMPPKDAPIKYTSPPWSVTEDGYLLDIKPHLHDGGLNMTFYVNGNSKCSSKAVYGGTGGGLAINGQKWETITAYTECAEPVQIKKGDSVTMDAFYDLTKHKLRPKSEDHSGEAEGMALATFLFARPYAK